MPLRLLCYSTHQAIVDRVSSVASAALVSSLKLMSTSPDIVRRWVNEANEAVNSDNVMVQYHALGTCQSLSFVECRIYVLYDVHYGTDVCMTLALSLSISQ